MKTQLLLFTFLFSIRFCQAQVTTILDSLDNPIALTFVGDNLFILLHGEPENGKLISFNINDPSKTIKIHLDGLTYPRAIIEKDSIIYIGLPSSIISYDLRSDDSEYKVVYLKEYFFPRSFLFVGNELFYAENNALSKIDISATNITSTNLFYFFQKPLSLFMEGTDIFIASGTSIFKYNLQSNTKKEIIKNLKYTPYSIIVIDNFLYIDYRNLNFHNEEIITFNLNNLELGYEVFCDDLISAISLQEYKGFIYLASQKPVFDSRPEGKIIRIDKELLKQPQENDLTIFPNPTSSHIDIKTLYINDMTYKLYDSNGKLIFSRKNISSIDLSEFPRGMYYLGFENVNRNIFGTKKILKIR